MAGEQLKFFTLENQDLLYYREKNKFVSGVHNAAHMTEELAQRIQKRYPGTTVEQNFGYDVHFKTSLAEVGEPETTQAIASAIRLAKRDGWSLATVLTQAELAFNGTGTSQS